MFRLLPSVDDVIQRASASGWADRIPRELLGRLARDVLARWRAEIASEKLPRATLEDRLHQGELLRELEERIAVELGRGIRRAINATGVVLHTGLGRAPVHPEAAEAMAEAARSYCVLELDRETGERGERDAYVSDLLARVSGAEAGIAVNNNAGAVLLVLNTFAAGRSAVVSRGELVEIGGSFRIPDVMRAAGALLCEVGTTNRTRLEDYRAAIGPDTGLLMKIHTSNFRIEGFAEDVAPADLARLSRAAGVRSAFDLGSGFVDLPGLSSIEALAGEPRVRAAVLSGVDVVLFSGDKLLGGPQAGLIAGAAGAVRELRKNPMYRALRLDKVALAGLEKTLEILLAGRGDEIPVRALLSRSAGELERDARELARAISALDGFSADVRPGASQPGSGSAPGVSLATHCVRVQHATLSDEALARRLRRSEPPVFARVQDGAVLLDPRTLAAGQGGDAEALLAAFRRVSASPR